MNTKEDTSKMMNQILRESRHNDNFHEDNWDTTGVQIRKSKYEENNHFEIPEEYLKMSLEELKQTKEEEWRRIQEKRRKEFESEIKRMSDGFEYLDKNCITHMSIIPNGENVDEIFRLFWQNTFADSESLAEWCKQTAPELFKPVDTVSSLKKRIKHCKNPMEKKNLERQLNGLYKERKKRHD